MEASAEMVTSVAQSVAAYGLAATFGVLLLKGIGIPIPIPIEVVLLATATRAAGGDYVPWVAFLAPLVALVGGGSVQYLLVRRVGRTLLSRYGRWVGLTAERVDAAAASIRKGGAVAVGLSLMTPGLRSTTIPASGLAGMPYRSFLTGLAGATSLEVAIHFACGYAALPVLGAIIHG